MAERLKLGSPKERRAKTGASGGSKKPAASTKTVKKTIQEEKATKKRTSSQLLSGDDGGDDDDDDDDLLDGLEEGGNGRGKGIFIVAAVGVVVLAAVAFLLLRGGKSEEEPPPQVIDPPPVEEPVDPGPSNDIGTQDFTANTTMTSSDVLTNPDEYLQDLYGLTTRVNYTVRSITFASDFVNYTKHRGTWGGGLELYWLDVTYRDKKYVIQVPFTYYKELTETGVVPVKMEVLTIDGSAGETLTVISYMVLDQETLYQVLDSQGK